jgi:hypothetical protein
MTALEHPWLGGALATAVVIFALAILGALWFGARKQRRHDPSNDAGA